MWKWWKCCDRTDDTTRDAEAEKATVKAKASEAEKAAIKAKMSRVKKHTATRIGVIATLVLSGGFLLVVSELELVKPMQFHAAVILAHLGVAFIIAGLVTLVLEIPDYNNYVADILADIVVREEYLQRLSQEQLIKLRRDCDTARLKLSGEETHNSFYRFVFEETWDTLIKSHYRTEYTQTAVYTEKGAPDNFLVKTQTIKYSLHKGVSEKPLEVPIAGIFEIDHELIKSQPLQANNNQQTCKFTGEQCCFESCKPVEHQCTFFSALILSIDDKSYALDLGSEQLLLKPIPARASHADRSGIPISFGRNLAGRKIGYSIKHLIPEKEKVDVTITETKLVRKTGEITGLKMSLPTKDGTFLFSFPEGSIVDATYFGYRDVYPFEKKETHYVFARVASWMLPGDGVALSWRVP